MSIGDIILDRCDCGGIVIAEIVPGGRIPLIHFQSFSDLEKFAMGLLGWCEYFQPKIPQVFVDAFKEEDRNAR